MAAVKGIEAMEAYCMQPQRWQMKTPIRPQKIAETFPCFLHLNKHERPQKNERKRNPIINPPVGEAKIKCIPPEKLLKTGIPIAPNDMYIKVEITPYFNPSK